MEHEKDGKLKFLDLTIHKDEYGFNYSIYKKPTHTDSVVPADSNHHMADKHAAFHAMVHRLASILMTAENFQK